MPATLLRPRLVMSTAAASPSAVTRVYIATDAADRAVISAGPVRVPPAWSRVFCHWANCCAMSTVSVKSRCCSAATFCCLATFTCRPEMKAAMMAATAEANAIQVGMWRFFLFGRVSVAGLSRLGPPRDVPDRRPGDHFPSRPGEDRRGRLLLCQRPLSAPSFQFRPKMPDQSRAADYGLARAVGLLSRGRWSSVTEVSICRTRRLPLNSGRVGSFPSSD